MTNRKIKLKKKTEETTPFIEKKNGDEIFSSKEENIGDG